MACADGLDDGEKLRVALAQGVEGVADELGEEAGGGDEVEGGLEGERDASGGGFGEGLEGFGADDGRWGPGLDGVEHGREVEAAGDVESGVLSDVLALGGLSECFGVEVDQVDFAMGLEESGEVEVVGVARAEDAEAGVGPI